MPRESEDQRRRHRAFNERGLYAGPYDPLDEPMVFLAKVGADERLHRQTHSVHDGAEFEQADDHGEGHQARRAVAP